MRRLAWGIIGFLIISGSPSIPDSEIRRGATIRRLLLLGIVGLLAISGLAAAQQACDTFPWNITATPGDGGNVLIAVCGRYTGCQPHAPSYQVTGSQIDVTLQAGLLPGCQCTTGEGSFGESLLVPSLPAGNYSIHVTLLYCLEPIAEGDASVVVGGAAASVPALDPRGAIAMVVLMAAVAAWRLRR